MTSVISLSILSLLFVLVVMNPNISSMTDDWYSKMTAGDVMEPEHQREKERTAVATWIDPDFSFAKGETINRDVVIQMRYPRKDRLGSNIKRPVYLMAYAHYYSQYFCIMEGRLGLANHFSNGFEVCPEGLADKLGWEGEEIFEHAPLNKSGVYVFKRRDRDLEQWFNRHQDVVFDEVLRKKWGNMIVDASLYSKLLENTTLARQDLFEPSHTDNPNRVTVAINIRRGDFLHWSRGLMLDQYYVILLRQLRSILTQMGKSPEVHLFSEDYGMIDHKLNITRNWTMYEGLVQHFHLAPDMNIHNTSHVMDLDLNLRDWRHFILADVLVVGATFSRMPALGRPLLPDPTTGLPLTIHMGGDTNRTNYNILLSKYGFKPDKFSIRNLPKVWETHNNVPMETFYADLLADWNAKYRNSATELDNGISNSTRAANVAKPTTANCNEFVVVTGCSMNHLRPLQLLLQSLRDRIVFNPNFPFRVRVIFYNLDPDPNKQKKIQDVLFHGNQDYSFLEYREFDYDAYPSHFMITRHYAWKGVIYEQVVREQRESLLKASKDTHSNSPSTATCDHQNRSSFVYWIDSGLCVTNQCPEANPFAPDIEYAQEYGFYSPWSSGLRKWTQNGTAEYLGLSQAVFENSSTPMSSSGISLVDVRSDFVYHNVIVPWRNCSLEKECIAPKGSSRNNHRQDQFVLSVLLAKNDIPVRSWTNCVVRGYTEYERPRTMWRYNRLKRQCGYNATFV